MLIEGFSATDYKRHLQKFLKFVVHNTDIAHGCESIYHGASRVLKRMERFSDDQNWSLKIDPWILPIGERDNFFHERGAFLLVSGEISIENSDLKTFVFSIGIVLGPPKPSHATNRCDRLNPLQCRMVRLFRFEVEEGNVGTSKPYGHMHHGGRTRIDWKNCTEDWIEKPKFPFPPFDLVLILELLMRQFDLGIPKKLFKETNWSSYIKKSEKMLLKEYYKSINKHFSDGQTTLLERLCKKASTTHSR